MLQMSQEQLLIMHREFKKLVDKKQETLDTHYKNAEVLMNNLGDDTPHTKRLLVATMTQIDWLEDEIRSIEKDIKRIEVRLNRMKGGN